jgi:hypothetical protein
VRIDHLQQVLGEGGKLGVDLELDSGGQEGKAFQQTLHIGVCALEGLQPKARGDLGHLLGEFAPHLAHEAQLAVVVIEQAWIHDP